MSDAAHSGDAAREPTPRVAEHAAQRWRERRGWWDPRLEVAWAEATPIDAEAIHSDRARWHAKTDTVLLANDDAGRDAPIVVTALPGSTHRARSVREAVAEARRR